MISTPSRLFCIAIVISSSRITWTAPIPETGREISYVDADSLIGPIMQPIAKLFDFYSRNKDALEMADKIDKQRKSNIFDPDNLLQALNLQPEEATTPQSLMDKLLEPIVGPLKREFSNTKKAHDRMLDGILPNTNSDSVRRAPIPPTHAPLIDPKAPFTQLLESLGMNAKPREEVHVGRDRSVSILGMPVGRRDGLSLSPMAGLSYGNQDMLGPIAVNDKYNVRWDFMDKFREMFLPQIKF